MEVLLITDPYQAAYDIWSERRGEEPSSPTTTESTSPTFSMKSSSTPYWAWYMPKELITGWHLVLDASVIMMCNPRLTVVILPGDPANSQC